MLSVIKVILIVAAVILTTANRTYAAHSGAECYLHGHRIFVPDGLNYPRQAWAGWGITCRTATPELAAGSGAIGADSGERPVEWCGWWMRQHLGGRYGPEFNVASNWLNAGRPLDGPRPGAIGVKAHHVFQVIRVVDRDHVLAISGNDHNDVRTRIRPTSDVIGWRDVTEESTADDKPAANTAITDKTAVDKIGCSAFPFSLGRLRGAVTLLVCVCNWKRPISVAAQFSLHIAYSARRNHSQRGRKRGLTVSGGGVWELNLRRNFKRNNSTVIEVN